GLDGGGGARLQVIAVYGLDVELDAERLVGSRGNFLFENLVGRRNKVIPAQPVHRRALGKGGRPRGGENSGNARGFRRKRPRAGQLQQLASMYPSHIHPPLE